MKKSALTMCAVLLSLSVFAYNPMTRTDLIPASQIKDLKEIEIPQVSDALFRDDFFLFSAVTKKNKIIIMDRNFKVIREECVEKMQDLHSRSTLVPIIYRSEFIAEIYQVSYFMLDKK